MIYVSKLTLKSAEAMAIELADRGEQFGAQTIAGLLVIIEDLRRHDHQDT